MKILSIIAAAALTAGAAVVAPTPAEARTFVSFGINTGPSYGYYAPYYGGYYGPRYPRYYEGYYSGPRYRGWDRGYRGWDRPRYRHHDRPRRWRNRW